MATVAAFLGLLALGLEGFQERASGSRARILLDEAHHNLFASAASGYQSFVRLVTDEGFSVTTNRAAFDAARLAATDILLITNPTGAGAAAQSLAQRLGVHLSASWTDDVAHRRTMPTYGPVFGYLVFARADGRIGDHPIMNGRDRSERVETVSTTTGGSISGPPDSVALLPLSPTALDWVPSATARDQARPVPPRDFNPCPGCETRSAAGRSQGIAFDLGCGRVVVIGEMGVLIDYAATTSNRQFALNIVRWLARDL